MIDQYPFEGFNDIYPDTRPTPNWFGFGLRNLEHTSSPVKHIVYANGQRRAVIQVRCEDCKLPVQQQIMDKLKGEQAEQPDLPIAGFSSHFRTPGAGHWGEPMWQMPDSRPGRLRGPERNR
jgi:hypothetical protein